MHLLQKAFLGAALALTYGCTKPNDPTPDNGGTTPTTPTYTDGSATLNKYNSAVVSAVLTPGYNPETGYAYDWNVNGATIAGTKESGFQLVYGLSSNTTHITSFNISDYDDAVNAVDAKAGKPGKMAYLLYNNSPSVVNSATMSSPSTRSVLSMSSVETMTPLNNTLVKKFTLNTNQATSTPDTLFIDGLLAADDVKQVVRRINANGQSIGTLQGTGIKLFNAGSSVTDKELVLSN